MRWDEFQAVATEAHRHFAAELLVRFAFGSINRYRVFNGDPHPGNYCFHPMADGTCPITFLDFGLVKRWGPGEFDVLTPVLDAVISGNARLSIGRAVEAGFLPADHGLDPDFGFEYLRGPYLPFSGGKFAYGRASVSEALATLIDIKGEHSELIKQLNVPASFVILDRVVWGVSALLGRLGGRNDWGAILAVYRKDAPPSTPMGTVEAAWRSSAGSTP